MEVEGETDTSPIRRMRRLEFERRLADVMEVNHLRRTQASLPPRSGHALVMVWKWPGRGARTTTADLFAHALPPSQRPAAQDLDVYLTGPEDDTGMTQAPTGFQSTECVVAGGLEAELRLLRVGRCVAHASP